MHVKVFVKKEKKKRGYIHDLHNIPNNSTKFQPNWIRTYKIQLKLLTLTAVSLKYTVTESGTSG